MASDFIDRLREASFPASRRGGYDTAAVDSYLRELADWLETGGDDQTRAVLVQREIERVGKRTGKILAAAQESADSIVADARAEAERVRAEAERETAEARAAADKYSTETCATVDELVRISIEEATRETADVRTKAEAEAKGKVAAATARLREAERAAAERTAGAGQEIADLVRTRAAIIANLEELASGIAGVVEGPGAVELKLPDGGAEVGEAAEEAEPEPNLDPDATEPEPEQEGEPEAGRPDSAREHQIVRAPVAAEAAGAGDSSPTRVVEPEAEGSETDETPLAGSDATAADEEPTRSVPAAADLDAAEQKDARERARQRELARRRNPQRDADPPTEDSDLLDLL